LFKQKQPDCDITKFLGKVIEMIPTVINDEEYYHFGSIGDFSTWWTVYGRKVLNRHLQHIKPEACEDTKINFRHDVIISLKDGCSIKKYNKH
jgi:hypothetical protein